MGSGIEGSARRYVKVRASGDKPLMAQVLVELCEAVAHADIDGDRDLINRFRLAAQDKWDLDDNNTEIDDDAVVSFDELGGAYVQAWVWIADSEVTDR